MFVAVAVVLLLIGIVLAGVLRLKRKVRMRRGDPEGGVGANVVPPNIYNIEMPPLGRGEAGLGLGQRLGNANGRGLGF